MLKTIRKHNKWLMVGFGVLLMVTWLIQPTLNQLSRAYDSRVVAKLDGRGITARDMGTASRELSVLKTLAPGFINVVGIEDHGVDYWLMLSREAEEAGFVGGDRDGETWDEPVATIAYQLAFREYAQRFGPEFARQLVNQQAAQQFAAQARDEVPRFIESASANNHLSIRQTHQALAKARGVYRMLEAYRAAGRLSDRAAIAKALEFLDSAKVNYVFVPAERLMDTVAAPTDEQVREHFDKFKTIKPGEGEFGIGYLLPARIKLEWMKIDRGAIESAVSLDPVEVRLRFDRGKASGKFKGEFAAEQPAIESEMKTQVVERAIQEAQVAVQTEILKATKILELDGRYKKLPEDWESRRPKFEHIAQVVVDAVKRATGAVIPLPAVTIKAADWLTQQEVRALPDLGRASLRAGGFDVPAEQVLFWAKGLPGGETGFVPIQPGVPPTESFLTDPMGNRFYFTVLAVRGESAPDSVDEKKDTLIKDWKTIRAFESLKGRVGELRTSAVSGGLDAILNAFPAVPTPADAKEMPTEPKYKALEITKDATVNTEVRGNFDPNLAEPEVYKAVLEAARKIDPLLPPEKVPADPATLCIAVPKRLGVIVVRIISPDPVTVEKFRQFELAVVRESMRRELADATPDPSADPFSLPSMLKRHRYVSGEKEIKSVEDLKKTTGGEGG